MRATFPAGWAYVSRRYTFTERDAAEAWVTVERALDRIEALRAGGPYLVGDTFTVADLTAAALLWPIAWPPEFPYRLPELPASPKLERLREHPTAGWIGDVYARHRPPSAEVD